MTELLHILATRISPYRALFLVGNFIALATCSVAAAPAQSTENARVNRQDQHVDLYGDPLPDRAIARLGTIRFHNEPAFGPPCLSHDGRLFASYQENGQVQVCERLSGKVRFTIARESHGDRMETLGFTVDRRGIVVRHFDGRLQLWDVASGNKVWQALHYKGESASFSADGERLTAYQASGRAFATFDLTTGRQIGSYALPAASRLRGWTILPNGEPVVATIQADHIRVFNLATHNQLGSFACKETAAQTWETYVLSPLGRRLACCVANRDAVRIWDVTSGAVREVQLPHKMPHDLRFSSDAATLVGINTDGEEGCPWLVLINVAAGTMLKEISGGVPEGVDDVRMVAHFRFGHLACALAPDGRTLAIQNDFSLRLWDIAGNRLSRHWYVGQTDKLPAPQFSGDGRFLAAQDGPTVRFWDLTDGRESPPLVGHANPVYRLAFSGNGAVLVSGGMDATVPVWNVASGKPLRVLPAAPALFGNLAVSPNGKTLTCFDGSENRVLHVWDVASGQQGPRFERFQDHRPPSAASIAGIPELTSYSAFVGGGAAVAAAVRGRDEVSLFDPHTGKQLRAITLRQAAPPLPFEEPDPFFEGLAACGDGSELAVCLGTRTIAVIDPATSQSRYRIEMGSEIEESHPQLFLSPDTRIVGMIRGLDPYFWDMRTGQQLFENSNDFDCVTAVICPDGRILAIESASKKSAVYLRDVVTGRRVYRFPILRPCTAAAFSPDGARVAVVERGNAIVVWDVDRLLKREAARTAALTERQLDRLWAELASGFADTGYRSVYALSHSPSESVPYLEAHLQPAKIPERATLQAWLDGLDSPLYAARARSATALDEAGDIVRPALRKALADDPSPEKRERLKQLLAASEHWASGPGRVRQWRAVMALEQANTEASRQLLRKLAGGAPEHWLTREAMTSLKRLESRSGSHQER